MRLKTRYSRSSDTEVLAGKTANCRYCCALIPASMSCCVPCAKRWMDDHPYGDMESWPDGYDGGWAP